MCAYVSRERERECVWYRVWLARQQNIKIYKIREPWINWNKPSAEHQIAAGRRFSLTPSSRCYAMMAVMLITSHCFATVYGCLKKHTHYTPKKKKKKQKKIFCAWKQKGNITMLNLHLRVRYRAITLLCVCIYHTHITIYMAVVRLCVFLFFSVVRISSFLFLQLVCWFRSPSPPYTLALFSFRNIKKLKGADAE